MSTEPDWSLYRTFLAVIEEGSLSGAARRMGLTQPTVARQIEALEGSLGRDLFLRSPRGLSPTAEALHLEPHAASLANAVAAFLRAASAEPGAVGGTVRITASEIVGVERLMPILRDLRARHPALQIELALSNSVENLLDRQADIAVRMVEPDQEALLAKRVPSAIVGLHAHKAYLAQRGAPASPEALKAFDLIGFDVETPAIRAVAHRFPFLRRADFALRADSDLAQLAAIRAGFGIGFCQVGLAARMPELVRVLPDAFSLELPTWVVMHENLRTTARCRTVFDALVDGLSAA